ncbi:hypothetical protein [Acidicapsa ligni]|uniref:hypothetical protein n=1 Tax=Acidicapsa ligni TaxID=542300 RepID=UPI0021E01B73|nr:hypothetical protein [Acidicapsa ligni]
MIRRSAITLVLILFSALLTSHAQYVLLIHNHAADPAEERQVQDVVEFFGLQLLTINVETPRDLIHELPHLKKLNVLAIATSAGALPSLNPNIQAQLHRPNGRDIPLLIFGIDAGSDPKQLQRWSGGALRGCLNSNVEARPQILHASSLPELKTLSGLDMPAVSAPTCQMMMSASIQNVKLLTTVSGSENRTVLMRAPNKNGDVFFSAHTQLFDNSWIGQPWGMAQAFSSLAPLIIFISQGAGDYAWHLDAHYANLTIDDPWLTEPYGNLSYSDLLAQMQLHKFHTTIAFVPWNFDRSDPKIVSLFRNNPGYFSISMHGNNHTHREFGNLADNPLSKQVEDMKQGVARMDKFTQTSGIHYDRVMVFPHGVAPQATFAALKSYGFLSTANSLDVPLDSSFPKSSLFILRPYTTAYARFLSLSRYSVEAPISHVDLAIQTFLGNPILLYGHEAFFRSGSEAFNPIADTLNHMQPDTQWTSLGNISRHMYLLRQRVDGDFDVRMLSNEMTLTNATPRDTTYIVAMASADSASISSVMINGAPGAINTAAEPTLRIDIPSHQSRTIVVNYSNSVNPTTQDLRRKTLHSYILRQISDFRDMYLSRHPWGRSLIGSYYIHNGESLESRLERRWYISTASILIVLGIIWYGLRQRKRRILDVTRISRERV